MNILSRKSLIYSNKYHNSIKQEVHKGPQKLANTVFRESYGVSRTAGFFAVVLQESQHQEDCEVEGHRNYPISKYTLEEAGLLSKLSELGLLAGLLLVQLDTFLHFFDFVRYIQCRGRHLLAVGPDIN